MRIRLGKICLVALGIGLCLFGRVLEAQQTILSSKPPAYPLAARAAGVDGPVVLKCTITTQGTVENLHVISGPPELRQAAIDAVSHWIYKPYRHFGRLVEVDTTVTVNFNMGSGRKKAELQAKAQAQLAQTAAQSAQPQNPDTKP